MVPRAFSQIGEFLERKECNAEGKTPAWQKKQALFQLCFTKFSQKNIHIKCDYLNTKKYFQK
jgi:hypothetical protein